MGKLAFKIVEQVTLINHYLSSVFRSGAGFELTVKGEGESIN